MKVVTKWVGSATIASGSEPIQKFEFNSKSDREKIVSKISRVVTEAWTRHVDLNEWQDPPSAVPLIQFFESSRSNAKAPTLLANAIGAIIFAFKELNTSEPFFPKKRAIKVMTSPQLSKP